MILTRAIGIDLGTTNSAVAMLDEDERELIQWVDELGRPILPSCVWEHPKTKELVVGFRAYARRGTRPEPISSIKRSMGTRTTIDFAGRAHTPSEISAYILRELRTKMEGELAKRSRAGASYDVSRAIITVPAYFGLAAIEATREAGTQAGLEVIELLHEPTAAAIYYSWKHNLGDGIYMVYDLGGGTFDVSVLQRTSGEFLVLGISGDNFLGGDDFDRRLAEYLRRLLVESGYDLDLDVEHDPEDRLRFNALVAMAEKAKKLLSEHEQVTFHDQGTLTDKSGAMVVVETELTRKDFEVLIGDLLERTIACSADAIQKAGRKSGITIESVDHILLVGGSTYVPAVAEKVRAAFCSDAAKGRAACPTPIRDEPDTAVALGAALRAASDGLGIGDDTRRIRLWFRGAGITKSRQTTIHGRVDVLDASLCLEGSSLRLCSSEGDILGDMVLPTNLQFTFPRVDLRTETLNEFQFVLVGASGDVVASLGRSIQQSTQQKGTVGRALSTAVLSKPIVLEGTDGDRLVRQLLLEEGTSLPAEAHFTFAVADDTGHIRLPIYQESRIIKELHATTGPVPVGTPVEVSISCDEQVHITVSFRIGDRQFGGRIEPPPPESVPTEFEVEQ